jgi:hypothetical protein
LTALWTRGGLGGGQDFVASAAYTWTGRPPLADRSILIGAPAGDGASAGASGPALVSDQPLALPDRLDLGLGFRQWLRPRLAAVVEATAAADVGARTATVDSATPIDVVAGLQVRFGGARVGLGLRYHGHALPSGDRRPSPLAGLVDVSGVDEAALADWLRAAGAGAAAPHLRAGSQRLLAGAPPGLSLPEGARVVPADYAVRSEHQLGLVIVCAWAF